MSVQASMEAVAGAVARLSEVGAMLDPRRGLPGPATIKLDEGVAHYMGDGMFVVDQVDDSDTGDARNQRVALSRRDLEAMLAAE